MPSQQFIDEMKSKLLEAKEHLTTEVHGLKEHTEIGSDMDENATEVQIDDVNLDLTERMNDDLEKIEAALARIEDGTYGTDIDGNEISEDRLRAIPWADTSI